MCTKHSTVYIWIEPTTIAPFSFKGRSAVSDNTAVDLERAAVRLGGGGSSKPIPSLIFPLKLRKHSFYMPEEPHQYCVSEQYPQSADVVHHLPQHLGCNQGHAIVGHVKTLLVLSLIVTDFQAIGNARAFIDYDFA